jgi:hypothetical protein
MPGNPNCSSVHHFLAEVPAARQEPALSVRRHRLGRACWRLVPRAGFEPAISGLKGRRPGPLDERGPRKQKLTRERASPSWARPRVALPAALPAPAARRPIRLSVALTALDPTLQLRDHVVHGRRRDLGGHFSGRFGRLLGRRFSGCFSGLLRCGRLRDGGFLRCWLLLNGLRRGHRSGRRRFGRCGGRQRLVRAAAATHRQAAANVPDGQARHERQYETPRGNHDRQSCEIATPLSHPIRRATPARSGWRPTNP